MKTNSLQKQEKNSSQILPSTENSDQAFKEQLTTVITQQLNDENSDLRKFIKDEMIKKAAMSFVEEFRSFLLDQKNQDEKGHRSPRLNLFLEPLPEQSDEDEEDYEKAFNELYSNPSSSDYRSFEDDLDQDSSGQSQNSIFTFQGKNHGEKQILLEENQNKPENSSDILLEKEEGRTYQNNQYRNRQVSKKSKVTKLKKKLRKKKFLGKKSSGPKISDEIIKKFTNDKLNTQIRDEKEKFQQSKGIKKIQKMIEKLAINEKEEGKANTYESESQEESNKSQKQRYYDQNFLDWEDLSEKEQNQNHQINLNQIEPLIASQISERTKTIKKIKRENLDENTIKLHFQFDVTDLISSFFKEQENIIKNIENNLQPINEIENSDKPMVEMTHSSQKQS